MNHKSEILMDLYDFYSYYKDKKFAPKIDLFPILASNKLAGIVADLMGDGNLQGSPKWRFDFSSNSIYNLLRFEESKGKIRECTTNLYGSMNYGINNKPIARILNFCGVPSGAKVHKRYLIPKWILRNRYYFRYFIKRYFDCEGRVDSSGAIMIEMWKNFELVQNGINFINQIKFYLEKYFNIHTTNSFLGVPHTTKSGITMSIKLKIRNKKSIRDFYEFIGFDDINKQQNLKFLISK